MSFLGKHAIVNNTVVSSSEATINITNKSYFYSYSVYESIKVLGGKGIFLKEHLERLFSPLAELILDTLLPSIK